MKKIFLNVLAFLLLFSCSQQEEQKLSMGNLEIASHRPQAGNTLDIRYSKDSLSEAPEAIAYYLTGNNNYPQDISLSKKESAYEGQLQIPDSASAVVINFKNGDTYDDNKKQAYVLPIYDENGTEKPEAKVAEAWFKHTRGAQYGYDISADSVFTIMNKAYKEAPETIRNGWMEPFMNVASRANQEQADVLIQEALNTLQDKEKLTEEDYTVLTTIYNFKNDQKATDSIIEMARTQYPKGKLAKGAFTREIRTASSLDEKEEVLNRYKEQIDTPGAEKDYLLSIVASAHLEEGNFERYRTHMEAMEDPLRKASSYNNTAWVMAERDENLDQAATLSKESLDLLEEAKNDEKTKPNYYTKSQFEDMLASSKSMYADTYAFIFFKQGNVKDALKYQEIAIADGAGADGNERYLQYLIANKNYDKALTKAKEFIKDNNASKQAKEYYKTAYQQAHTDKNDVEDQLAALEEIGREKAFNDLRKTMIDEEAPQFSLTNLDGKQIALADLKGKTVVLDFWATWCGPCKVSFPGMQMAVDKYQDNPDVEFLFVDTWESTSGEERENSVKQFITENEYSFNVLMDTPVEEGSREYEVVGDYEVSGIPTKFIIAPDGRIKFKAVGFDGNTEGLAEEIDMMINLARTKTSV